MALAQSTVQNDNKTQASAPGYYLANIEVIAGSLSEPLAADSPLTLDLHSSDVAGLRAQLVDTSNLDIVNASEGSLRIRLSAGAKLTRPPSPPDHAASWVIDYDQPAVSTLGNLWREKVHSETPTPGTSNAANAAAQVRGLINFTADQIDNPNSRHGLLIASQVAKRREGDCTEYAVLQTALARGAGYASRMVLGIVLVAAADEIRAYGHAWSEVHTGNQWVLADATQLALDEGVQGVWHLPIRQFEDEGFGHVLEMLKFAEQRPSSLTLIHNFESPGNIDSK